MKNDIPAPNVSVTQRFHYITCMYAHKIRTQDFEDFGWESNLCIRLQCDALTVALSTPERQEEGSNDCGIDISNTSTHRQLSTFQNSISRICCRGQNEKKWQPFPVSSFLHQIAMNLVNCGFWCFIDLGRAQCGIFFSSTRRHCLSEYGH